MNEIAAFLASTVQLINLAKAAVSTRDEAKLIDLKIDLGNAILELQEKQAAVISQNQAALLANEEFKKEIAAFDKWEQDSKRYKLHSLEGSNFVYALQNGQAHGQPAHWLCAACFHDRVKSILQSQDQYGQNWNCPRDVDHALNTQVDSQPTFV